VENFIYICIYLRYLQKTPEKEIDMALKLKEEYFNTKKKENGK